MLGRRKAAASLAGSAAGGGDSSELALQVQEWGAAATIAAHEGAFAVAREAVLAALERPDSPPDADDRQQKDTRPPPATADEADRPADDLRQKDNQQIPEATHKVLHLRGESIPGFHQESHLALPPAQLIEFSITRFG